MRLTRSAIGVRVRGQQGTAISRLVPGSSPDGSTSTVEAAEHLNQQNEALKELYRQLIKPIEGNLPASNQARIVFIPQGALSFVPFAALKDDAGRYLVEKHTIQTAPNFRTLLLANFRQQRRSSDNRNVLIVGDPTMPRPQGNIPSLLQLDALPNARKEAEAVSDLFRSRGYEPELLMGDHATKSRVRNRMKDARIIHLATHGILDAELENTSSIVNAQTESTSDRFGAVIRELLTTVRPAGAVALAPSSNNTNENGFLTSAEIFQMNLKADLVVLSACNTGRGPLTPGGVVGLPFSLSIAGVPSTVVSLWAVADDSTAKLMTKFYESYLTSNSSNKAKALRQAMLYMIESGYRDRPVDWAAFTLVGTSN